MGRVLPGGRKGSPEPHVSDRTNPSGCRTIVVGTHLAVRKAAERTTEVGAPTSNPEFLDADGKPPRMVGSTEVDRYIGAAPREYRERLRSIRSAIRRAAPDAIESLTSGIPFYTFRGEVGPSARLCFFRLLRDHLVFYMRPAFLEGLGDELEPYRTGTQTLHFRLDRPVPIRLIGKVVANGVRKHRASRPH